MLHLLCYNGDIFLHVLGAENKTTAGHSPLPWKRVRPHSRGSLVLLKPLSRSVCRITQSLFYKTHTCLFYSFYLFISVKMVACIKPATPPSLHLTSCNLVHTNLQPEMTHNNGTWDTMPTLLPWQPSQRITILQHTTPPTTLAAVDKCSSSSPSAPLWGGRGSPLLLFRLSGLWLNWGVCLPWQSCLFAPSEWQQNEPLSQAVHSRGKYERRMSHLHWKYLRGRNCC